MASSREYPYLECMYKSLTRSLPRFSIASQIVCAIYSIGQAEHGMSFVFL